MSFCLRNARDTLRWPSDIILSSVKRQHDLVYLNNAIIFSLASAKNIDLVSFIMTILREATVALKLKRKWVLSHFCLNSEHIIEPGRLKNNLSLVRCPKRPEVIYTRDGTQMHAHTGCSAPMTSPQFCTCCPAYQQTTPRRPDDKVWALNSKKDYGCKNPLTQISFHAGISYTTACRKIYAGCWRMHCTSWLSSPTKNKSTIHTGQLHTVHAPSKTRNAAMIHHISNVTPYCRQYCCSGGSWKGQNG